ncbi:tail fiber domain-containing protein [Mangrovibacterium sp.]|uniref:tail fiber domain-containing protein n=1 Tax=Mangrovibacterium sp. TaxID=1961364 RepID=UPI00356AF5A4
MKNVLLLAVFSLFCLAAKAQIKVNSTGKVGINNTSPTYQLDVSGTFRVNDNGDALIYQYGEFYPNSGWSSLGNYSYMWDEVYAYQGYFYYCDIYYSDANLKTEIKNLNSASDRLKELRPVSYKMKPHVRPGNEADVDVDVNAEQMGFIAQEMQEIFPEIVVKDKNGVLGIRYTELIPVLVKAFQEQQQVIEELRAKVEELQATKN